jgi:hypothetical protein
VAIYLFVLGFWVNRRRYPVVMSGSANMVWLLLALAGFFVIGPPSWIAFAFLAEGAHSYWIAYGIYMAVLALIASRLIVGQRQSLVIYNVNPAQLAELLQEVLEDLKIDYTATPGRVALADGRLVLDIESSYLWNNVVIRWHGRDAELRATVQEHLAAALRKTETEGNGSSTLLVLTAMALGMFCAFAFAVRMIVPD